MQPFNNTNINNQFSAQQFNKPQPVFSSQGVMLSQFQPTMQQQPVLLQQQPVLLQQQPVLMRGLPLQQGLPIQQGLPLHQIPLQQQAPLAVGAGKARKGHHHGLRKSRSEGVIPAALVPIVQTQQVQQFQQFQQFQQVQQMRDISPSVATETIVRPAQVIETVRTDRVLEVQPVIHREIDQSVINHIERHVTEAPAVNRGGVVQMAPIVQETVVRREIDEVQPVIHRELASAVRVRQEEHLIERVVAPTQHTNQVIVESVAPVMAVPVVATPLVKTPMPLMANQMPATQAF